MKTPTLRWRVLLVLSLAAVLPTVVVGVLAILRARHDVESGRVIHEIRVFDAGAIEREAGARIGRNIA